MTDFAHFPRPGENYPYMPETGIWRQQHCQLFRHHHDQFLVSDSHSWSSMIIFSFIFSHSWWSSFPGEKLSENATSTPDVHRSGVGGPKKDFRGSVPQGHYLKWFKHLNAENKTGHVFFSIFSFSSSSSFGGGIINNRNAWVGFILNRDIVGGEVGTQRCYQASRHPEKSTYY